jgi:hypothetical protein
LGEDVPLIVVESLEDVDEPLVPTPYRLGDDLAAALGQGDVDLAAVVVVGVRTRYADSSRQLTVRFIDGADTLALGELAEGVRAVDGVRRAPRTGRRSSCRRRAGTAGAAKRNVAMRRSDASVEISVFIRLVSIAH